MGVFRRRFWFWAYCLVQGFLGFAAVAGAVTFLVGVTTGVILPTVGVYTLFERSDSLGGLAMAIAVVAVLLLVFLAEGSYRVLEKLAPARKRVQQEADSGNVNVYNVETAHFYGAVASSEAATSGTQAPISDTFHGDAIPPHTLVAPDDPPSRDAPNGRRRRYRRRRRDT